MAQWGSCNTMRAHMHVSCPRQIPHPRVERGGGRLAGGDHRQQPPARRRLLAVPRWHAVGEGDESRRDALPNGSNAVAEGAAAAAAEARISSGVSRKVTAAPAERQRRSESPEKMTAAQGEGGGLT